jgi:hypothetical protein
MIHDRRENFAQKIKIQMNIETMLNEGSWTEFHAGETEQGNQRDRT